MNDYLLNTYVGKKLSKKSLRTYRFKMTVLNDSQSPSI